MSEIFQVLYTCAPCGILDRKVTVAHRKHGEPIGKWMQHVSQRIADDHRSHSPLCTAKAMTNAKIPLLNETAGIGFGKEQK